MKLIIATPSPFARKARVALREKNVPFEEIIDVPWNKNTITKGLNPLGKIPILLEDEGQSFFDSRIIVQYLDIKFPTALMYPQNPEENLNARIIETAADGLCDAVVLNFLEHARTTDLRSQDWIDRQQRKIAEATHFLSNRLEDRLYFVGDHITIADVGGFSSLEYLDLRYPELDWRSAYPNLTRFWEHHKDRPSFLTTQPTAQTIEPLAR